MTQHQRKRVYNEAAPWAGADGYGVALDTRSMHTPGGNLLTLASWPLAEAVAAEWDAQAETIDPRAMPLTRLACTLHDRVVPQWRVVADTVLAHAETDLLCYRADSPAELVAREAEAWDPPLAWAAETLGAPLRTQKGILPLHQPQGSLDALAEVVQGLSPEGVTALQSVTGISSSLVLGLALVHGYLDAAAVTDAAHVDEDYQAEQWGTDDEALTWRAMRAADIAAAERFLALAEQDAPA